MVKMRKLLSFIYSATVTQIMYFFFSGCRERDTERLALFPSLDYKGLYTTLLQFLDIVDLLPNGLYDFGKALLVTLCSLVPFLERELIDTLPYVVASTLISFPDSLVEEVVDCICYNLLPFTITNSNHPVDNCVLSEDVGDFKRSNYAFDSAPSILMMVFQFVKDNSAIHRKITETLMALKEDVIYFINLVACYVIRTHISL